MPKPTPDDYRDNVGHDPPVDDTPDAWQWSYEGTRAEREGLLERVADAPLLPDDQDTLF